MAMEIESNFLSSGKASTKLAPILKQVIRELNTKGKLKRRGLYEPTIRKS